MIRLIYWFIRNYNILTGCNIIKIDSNLLQLGEIVVLYKYNVYLYYKYVGNNICIRYYDGITYEQYIINKYRVVEKLIN